MLEKRHFFISHSGADVQYALWLCDELARLGYSYHEQQQWPPGSPFVRLMSEAIDASDYTLALFSRSYFEDDRFTDFEWAAAIKKIVGIRIDSAEPLTILKSRSYIDMTQFRRQKERSEHLARELAKLKLTPHSSPWRPSSTSRARNAEAALIDLSYLCDREKPEQHVLDLLDARSPEAPVIIVVHGDEEEIPDEFWRRVAKVSLPRHLATIAEPRIRDVFIAFPAVADAAALRRALKRDQKHNMLNGYAPEDALIVRTRVVVEDTSGPSMQGLLDAYLRFWCDANVGRGCVFVICLAVHYRSSMSRSPRFREANRVVRESVDRIAAAAAELHCTVLDAFGPVKRGEAENWVDLVRARDETLAVDHSAVRELFDKPARKTEIPMAQLVPRLQKLLRGEETE